MEFEELKVEIPADDSDNEEKDLPSSFERRYENKSGCFVTGFDVTSKEALERKARRAKRFGLQSKHNDTEKTESHSDGENHITLANIDVKELPAISDGEVRLDAILIHGVDNMSTKDIFAYFGDFAPGSVEWIDDSSCNVVWDDDFSASRVLMTIGKDLQKPADDSDDNMSETVEVRWKLGPPHPNAQRLLLRTATKKDKKRPGAARRSMYYLVNGKRNSSARGSKKGIVSSSRKRKILMEQERIKHMYTGGPQVLFLDKIETDKEEKMDIDEPPLKIVVTNEGPTERSNTTSLRMRMYADSLEDDESESDDDDDSREKRDRWKGRIDRKQNTKREEEVKNQPALDLRSKLLSRERHGFNFKNRPSLSIEIKEEAES